MFIIVYVIVLTGTGTYFWESFFFFFFFFCLRAVCCGGGGWVEYFFYFSLGVGGSSATCLVTLTPLGWGWERFEKSSFLPVGA